MEKGVVKFFNEVRGYGFITKDDGLDIFFHVTELEFESVPQQGEEVNFTSSTGDKGSKAIEISLV